MRAVTRAAAMHPSPAHSGKSVKSRYFQPWLVNQCITALRRNAQSVGPWRVDWCITALRWNAQTVR